MKVLVDKDFLEDGLELICDKVRLKTGGSGVLAFPVEIAEAVDSIETGSGGITPTGTKTITENGEGIDVTSFAAVDVAVPTGITPTGTKQITANGTGIDVAQYAAVDVAVPTGITPTGTKQITANGTGIDVEQYAAVDVAVPSGGYDKAEMNGNGRSATANSGTKLTVECYILQDEALAGVYIKGINRNTLWGVYSLLLIGSGNNWHAEAWRHGSSGPVEGIGAPNISVSSVPDGIYTHYTIEITLTSTYNSFITTASNYTVIPIRLAKS